MRTPWWRTWLTQIPRISLIFCGWEISQRLVVGCLTQIPRISLISLWVENLTEVGDAHDYMGFPIHRVLRVLRVLYSICLPRLNSDSWDSWFPSATNLHKFSRIIFRCDFSYICGWSKKTGCTGWCTLCVRICDWSDRRDSNPRPSAWEANALPTEPLSHNVDIFIAPYGGLLLLNSLRRLLLRECRLLSRCRLLPMRQCCRGWVRDKRSRGVLFDRLQRRCCS